jgi:hypothetical protein
MANPAEQRMVSLEQALATLSFEVAAYVRESRADTANLKSGMAEFKNEMAEFKNESRRDMRDLNRKLGEIAASQGKLVEDIAAPSVPRILRTLLGLPEEQELDFFAIRLKLAHPVLRGQNAELDTIVAHGRTALVVEAKLRLTPERSSRVSCRVFASSFRSSPTSGFSARWRPCTSTRPWSRTARSSVSWCWPRATTCSASRTRPASRRRGSESRPPRNDASPAAA